MCLSDADLLVISTFLVIPVQRGGGGDTNIDRDTIGEKKATADLEGDRTDSHTDTQTQIQTQTQTQTHLKSLEELCIVSEAAPIAGFFFCK